VPPPAAVISPENEEKRSGFDRNFADFVLRRPATDSGKQLDLRIGFRPDFEGRFRPLPISFWCMPKNKSDFKYSDSPRVGLLSRDVEIFR
ncbi:unnamed protein product, partial [Prunus brigantina]